MSVENLKKKTDPFTVSLDDLDEDNLDQSAKEFAQSKSEAEDLIHIRIQQRNGRKSLTTVQGLPKSFDLKKTLKIVKKEFSCNGSIEEDPKYGQVIQLQGDHRREFASILTEDGTPEKSIKIHGF